MCVYVSVYACVCVSEAVSSACLCVIVMPDLVHESANEVDETTLQLGQFFGFVSVHHGLEGEKERETYVSAGRLVNPLMHFHFNVH